jgi:hypothetical protein
MNHKHSDEKAKAKASGTDYTHQRIGKRKLECILERTGKRDRALLQSLNDYRYLLTGQVHAYTSSNLLLPWQPQGLPAAHYKNLKLGGWCQL